MVDRVSILARVEELCLLGQGEGCWR
jgi:hypothetical protein